MLTASNLMVPKQVPTDQSHEAGGRGKALPCSAVSTGDTFPLHPLKYMNNMFLSYALIMVQVPALVRGQTMVSFNREENRDDLPQCQLGEERQVLMLRKGSYDSEVKLSYFLGGGGARRKRTRSLFGDFE